MNKSDTLAFDTTQLDDLSSSANPHIWPFRIRSPKLSLQESTMLYELDGLLTPIDLSKIFLPPTVAQPGVVRLSDNPLHVCTVLAAADRRISEAKDEAPPTRAITRQVYLIRHTLDWLRERGIYHLSDAKISDIKEMMSQFAVGGWSLALSLEARWERALEDFRGDEIKDAFHFRSTRNGTKIEGLKRPFWNERLGWGGNPPLTERAKTRIETIAKGWQFTEGWQARRNADNQPPSSLVLRNTIGWINDLAALPGTVDKLPQRVWGSTAGSTKRLAKKQSTSTRNLGVDDAIKLMTSALHLLYDVSPLLLTLLKQHRSAFPALKGESRRTWLSQSKARMRLEEVLGRKILYWNWMETTTSRDKALSVNELVSAVQGACGIVLAAMNARRQREICDARRGVRVGDLAVLDESLGLFQCNFYIEKTYRDRHRFYVNRASADALRCLEALKKVSVPATQNSRSPSLFSCYRIASEGGPTVDSHFAFTHDPGRTRSLSSFFRVAFGTHSEAPEVSAHMFRRFYAILYFHQYEHAELRALRQHLRHLDVAMTRVYVTDPSSRPVAEQIKAKFNKNRFNVASEALQKSLEETASELDDALAEMSGEKLFDAVTSILKGEPTAGGFSRIVRKLYRQTQSRVVIDATGSETPAEKIVQLLEVHGYKVKPMHHGQCHAPDSRRLLKGACQKDGILARENATPSLCNACAFHFNNQSYVENLKEDLIILERERHDFMLTPLQQARASFDFENLSKVIVLTERQMSVNSTVIKALSKLRANPL